MPDALADVLVERDGVAEACAARMRCGGEKAIVRGMSAIHVRMPHAAEDRKIVAVVLQQFEVRRERVVAATVLREEIFRQQTEVIADAKEAARFSAGRRVGSDAFGHGCKNRRHRIQQR
jgi:hypothetical protein